MKTLEEYLQMIPSQYQKATKFLAWMSINLGILKDIGDCIDSLPAAFGIDNAVGVQLDILGMYLGQSRVLSFTPSDGSSSTLDDTVYRKILKMKTMTNYWDGSLKSIYRAWNSIFTEAQLVIVDNMNMSANIIITGNLPQIVLDMVQRDLVLPRPEGVQYIYGELPAAVALFAYDYEDDESPYFGGYDIGYWDSSI